MTEAALGMTCMPEFQLYGQFVCQARGNILVMLIALHTSHTSQLMGQLSLHTFGRMKLT